MLSRKTSTLLASLTLLTAVSATSAYAEDAAWQVNVAPYVWAIAMNGHVQSGTRQLHVNQSFSDLVSEMNFGGMLWVEAKQDKVSFFANVLYASLENDEHVNPVYIDATNKFGIFSGGMAYEIYKYCFGYSRMGDTNVFTLEPYLGLRYTINNTSINVKDLPAVNIHLTNDQNWTDPFIGLRLNWAFGKVWSLMLAGDVGGRNRSDQYSYNATGLIGYKPQSWGNATIYLGYRILDQRYQDGSGTDFFDWNMKLSGPLLGVNFAF